MDVAGGAGVGWEEAARPPDDAAGARAAGVGVHLTTAEHSSSKLVAARPAVITPLPPSTAESQAVQSHSAASAPPPASAAAASCTRVARAVMARASGAGIAARAAAAENVGTCTPRETSGIGQ